MKKHIVGVIDYGAGNCASVKQTICKLGYRTRLVTRESDFSGVSVLLIPGVGAFASAMKALDDLSLIEPIRNYALQGGPLIGVCLGMQLLADGSYEQGFTTGLGLISGYVKAIENPRFHIGWNTIDLLKSEKDLSLRDGGCFYFNHAYEFQASNEYVTGVARIGRPIVAMVRKRNICGFQFHPEKSQIEGVMLMKNCIDGLISA